MGRSRPGRRKRTALTVLAVFGIVLFSALGIWQVERRSWKLALIEAVDARVQASPVSAPPPAVWPSIERERHAYLHVVARGRFLHDRETLVRAVTDLGTGFWVLTPLGTDTGFVVLVNRGYVPGACGAGHPGSQPPGARDRHGSAQDVGAWWCLSPPQ